MKNFTLLSLSFLLFFAGSISPYQIFTSDGQKTDFEQIVNQAKDCDVVFFGELHNSAIAHWLQYELTKSLFELKGNQLVLGAEMFEADQQLLMNEYLGNIISESSFEKEARLWPNYQTDYKPLVLFAKEKNLPFIATNIPRRYASVVAKYGLDTLDNLLDKEAKKYIARLPIAFDPELPGYKNMVHQGGGPGMKYIAQAQAIKDATMAYFIEKNLKKNSIFLHFNGAYHTNNYEGIIWYLKKLKPGLKILTITTEEQENIEQLEQDKLKLADFIIVVKESMTKTH
ncbi:MAG TPA: ChaN family lipoprotein [Bacteroidia bacterium]|nr:ChaN family lipoprotein [Sphingobacteriales bacterium]HPD66154.1 ChaN family lipoprotein [Bacteroidia bacterium]HRS59803.1 ChaN family lipoprotein [Bacteroidia bacterium]HRU68521.1 ChaN family lipoprotein [Bacteroidia bacterium]